MVFFLRAVKAVCLQMLDKKCCELRSKNCWVWLLHAIILTWLRLELESRLTDSVVPKLFQWKLFECCTYTGGGGWRDGCSLEAGSHSLGSGPGGKAAENAETAGNCMALRNGLSGAGAELGLSESGMRLVTAAVLQSCLSQWWSVSLQWSPVMTSVNWSLLHYSRVSTWSTGGQGWLVPVLTSAAQLDNSITQLITTENVSLASLNISLSHSLSWHQSRGLQWKWLSQVLVWREVRKSWWVVRLLTCCYVSI